MNKSLLMQEAWKTYRDYNMQISFSECLKKVWNYFKNISNYEQLLNYKNSSSRLEYDLYFMFKKVTDIELKEMYIEEKCFLSGYCYNPELKSEFNRRNLTL